MPFTHLQVISTNSLMKSTLMIDDLIECAKKQGHQSIALTDSNNLIGAIEFYEKAIKAGIKPILGMTLNVQSFYSSEASFSMLVLAKNNLGYKRLLELATHVQFNEQKFISLDELSLVNENLFIISPSFEGEIYNLIQSKQYKQAEDLGQFYMKQFNHFYIGLSLQEQNETINSFYKQTDLPVVALGDVRYLTKGDALPSKVLQVLEKEMPLGDEGQAAINHFISSDNGEFSLTPPKETFDLFKNAGFEEGALQTTRIAEQISLDINLKQRLMPTFPVPEGETADSYLRKLCLESLETRVENPSEDYFKRLNTELEVILSMNFSDYFLIVWDIMVFAHNRNIFTGSGRGSAAGSLVAYLLKITNVDPIQYNLLFERFLNKDRYTMPDIDLDFPDIHREEILNYIYQKYGNEYVAQIGTIGTYGAKSSVRDVGRVFGLSQDELSKWSKAIPSGPNVTLKSASQQQALKDLLNENSLNQRIFQVAQKIETRMRHISTHAAAVVISDEPLTNRVPLQKGGGDIPITQYTMESVEKVGLLKLDILGLRNLTTLADSLRYIPYENDGRSIDIDSISPSDEKTLEIFRQGHTNGVFQFESPGIRRVLRKLQPNTFEDIVAVNALYRPGPMEQIDTFIARKNGNESIRYPHEDLKDILEITYGVMVYQEQVMQVASKLAGYTLNEADILRRAISKKDHQAIEEGRKDFVAGAIQQGYTQEVALEVYGYIERFADYGFNRSHAVAYSKVAYQLAYVKANFPASFYAAVMNASGTEKVKQYAVEAKRAGVKFLGPNINKSFQSVLIENNQIRFGFNIIKGIPRDFIRNIIDERKRNGVYSSFIQFLNRIDNRWLKEDTILPLIYSGTFDHFTDTRAALIESLTSVLESVSMSSGNTELFDIFAPIINEKPELSDEEKMKQEFEVTGYYFTAEPGEKYNQLRDDSSIVYLADAKDMNEVTILVLVEKITRIQTKNGHPMSFVDAIDSSGKVSLTLFPNVHRQAIQLFDEGDTILVKGKVEKNQVPLKIIANKITNAKTVGKEKGKEKKSKQVLYIRFESLKNQQRKLNALQTLIKQYHGDIPVVIYDEETKEQKVFKKEFNVNNNPNLMKVLVQMFDEENILLK